MNSSRTPKFPNLAETRIRETVIDWHVAVDSRKSRHALASIRTERIDARTPIGARLSVGTLVHVFTAVSSLKLSRAATLQFLIDNVHSTSAAVETERFFSVVAQIYDIAKGPRKAKGTEALERQYFVNARTVVLARIHLTVVIILFAPFAHEARSLAPTLEAFKYVATSAAVETRISVARTLVHVQVAQATGQRRGARAREPVHQRRADGTVSTGLARAKVVNHRFAKITSKT